MDGHGTGSLGSRERLDLIWASAGEAEGRERRPKPPIFLTRLLDLLRSAREARRPGRHLSQAPRHEFGTRVVQRPPRWDWSATATLSVSSFDSAWATAVLM